MPPPGIFRSQWGKAGIEYLYDSQQIMNSCLIFLPVSIPYALSAGSLKKPGISSADALIAATSDGIGAVVVSGDKHFSNMGLEIRL